jgi:anthranilate/para-aminobenzoate synthase component I
MRFASVMFVVETEYIIYIFFMVRQNGRRTVPTVAKVGMRLYIIRTSIMYTRITLFRTMNRHNATRRISLQFESLIPFLESQSAFVLLESNRDDTHARFSYLFTDPVDILRTAVTEATAARDILARLSNHSRNRHVAGYLSYEFGYYLHERLHPLREKRPGEVWFGVFPEPVRFDHRKGVFSRTIPLAGGAAESRRRHSISAIKIGIKRDTYTEAIAKIKNHIAEGDTYQVNYTTKLSFDFSGSPLSLYAALRRRQPTSYSALIRDGEDWILSLSPELFYNVRNGIITARPMKGTMRRGRTTEEDRMLADALHRDEKNRAENVMIVDLMRNDIGSIAATGSVKVPELYTVEKYRTVLQMTSTVTGTLRKGISPGRYLLTSLSLRFGDRGPEAANDGDHTTTRTGTPWRVYGRDRFPCTRRRGMFQRADTYRHPPRQPRDDGYRKRNRVGLGSGGRVQGMHAQGGLSDAK